MAGDFIEKIDGFLAKIEGEKIKGIVEVDQVYAHYQHSHPEFHHPSGGEAFYLQTPLYAKAPQYLSHIASKAVTSSGPQIGDAMSDNMEALSLEVYDRAPWEFADLRASGHPMVEADGAVIYDRAPLCRRLSVDELKIKSELSYLLWPDRYKKGRQ